jgi:Ni,Fe-hydrogenase III component G
MSPVELAEQIEQRWRGKAQCTIDAPKYTTQIHCVHAVLPELCGWLFLDLNFGFAGLIVEEGGSEWELRYSFYGEGDAGWVHVLLNAPLAEKTFPSIVKFVHAADWHEREAEDLFGLVFKGHPRLGDFVLHDDAWQEGVEPMRTRRCCIANLPPIGARSASFRSRAHL